MNRNRLNPYTATPSGVPATASASEGLKVADSRIQWRITPCWQPPNCVTERVGLKRQDMADQPGVTGGEASDGPTEALLHIRTRHDVIEIYTA